MFSAPFDGLPKEVRLVTEPILSEIDKVVIDCAEHWADDEFDAPDGRSFRLLYGDKIFSRDTQLNAAARATLDAVAAAIVEMDSGDKPLCFHSVEQADQAWVDLQASFVV